MVTENMNILLSCDDRYAKYVPVLLNSIFAHHENIPINIYLMYIKETPIQSETLYAVDKHVNTNGMAKITYIAISMDDLMFFSSLSDVMPRLNKGRIPLEGFLYFVCHKYLPEEVNRCLYLDIDTLVNANIYEFYQTDFEDNYLAVISSKRKTFYTDVIEYDMSLVSRGEYFNSGVILMNVFKLRSDAIGDEYYRECIEKVNKKGFLPFRLADQSLANCAFIEKSKFIHDKDYNKMINAVLKGKKIYTKKERTKWRILHHNCSGYKAWNFILGKEFLGNNIIDKRETKKDVLFYFDLFWNYAIGTPFYEEILTKAKENTGILALSLLAGVNKKNRKLESEIERLKTEKKDIVDQAIALL